MSFIDNQIDGAEELNVTQDISFSDGNQIEPLEQSEFNHLNNKKSVVSVEKLEEFDVHVGLKVNNWNPKMQDFIYSKKHNHHIIDIRKSIHFLNKAYLYISDLVKAGIDIVFVSVKNKHVSSIVKDAVQRVNGYYLTQRWLGGLLTNFHQISKTIKKLNELDELLSNKELSSKYTKKELVNFAKEKNKLEKFYSGIKNLTRIPSLLVVFNPVEDYQVVREAKKMGIPVVALSNTNANPDVIDFIIPGNSNSPKSIYLIANILCDAIAEVNGQETLIAHKEDKDISMPEEYIRNKSQSNLHERGKTLLM